MNSDYNYVCHMLWNHLLYKMQSTMSGGKNNWRNGVVEDSDLSQVNNSLSI
jgi:hypothetical protein